MLIKPHAGNTAMSKPSHCAHSTPLSILLCVILFFLAACGAFRDKDLAQQTPCQSTSERTDSVELVCLTPKDLLDPEQLAYAHTAYKERHAAVVLTRSTANLIQLLETNTDSFLAKPDQNYNPEPVERYLQAQAILPNGTVSRLNLELNEEIDTTTQDESANIQLQAWLASLSIVDKSPNTSAWTLIESTTTYGNSSYQDALLTNKLHAFAGFDPAYDHYLIESTLTRTAKKLYCRSGFLQDNDMGYYPWENRLSISHTNTVNLPDKPIILATNSSSAYGNYQPKPRGEWVCAGSDEICFYYYAGDSLTPFSKGLEAVFSSERASHLEGKISTTLVSSAAEPTIVSWVSSAYRQYGNDSDNCNWSVEERLPRLSVLSLPKGKPSEVTLDATSNVRRTKNPAVGSRSHETKETPFRETLALRPDTFDFDKNPIRLPALLEGATGTIPRYEKVVRTLLSKSSNAVTPIDWEITGIPDWLTVTPAQGSGDTAITFQTRDQPTAEAFSNGVKVSFTQKRNQNTPIEIQIFPEDPPPTLKAVNELGEIDTATLSYFVPANINIQYYIPNENPDQRSRWYITDLPWWAEVSGSSLSNFSAQCLMSSSLAAARGYPICPSRGSVYVNTTFTLSRRTVSNSTHEYFDSNITSCGYITLTSDTQDPVLAPDGAYWSKQLNLCWK
jgi:hypothetical protein